VEERERRPGAAWEVGDVDGDGAELGGAARRDLRR
jgi:hypothetical protein